MSYLSNVQEGFDWVFDAFKQQVTVYSVTYSRNDESDVTRNVGSGTTVDALIEYYTDDYYRHESGEIDTGDALAIFEPNTSVSIRDYVDVGSTRFEVDEITTANVAGTTIYIEARLNKVT